MKNIPVWLAVCSFMVLSGCSNVRYVKARDNCERNLLLIIPWDHCSEKGEPLRQIKMVGDTGAGSAGTAVKEEPAEVSE